MSKKSNCEDCMNYIYDEFCDCYICLVDLDQDEMEDFLSYATENCPTTVFSTITPWPANSKNPNRSRR